MPKHVKAIFVALIVVVCLSFTVSVTAQEDIQDQRIDELFRRYDSLASEQGQINQRVSGIEQTVQRFDSSVNQLTATVAQLADILSTIQNQQGIQVMTAQARAVQPQAMQPQAFTTPDSFGNTASNTANSNATNTFASTASIFPDPTIPSAGIEGNFSASPGVIVQPQPIAGAVISTQISTQISTPLPAASSVAAPIATAPIATAPSIVITPVSGNGVVSGGTVFAPPPVAVVNPPATGVIFNHQATPAFGIQNVNGSSPALPTGSFSPSPFLGTQTQLPSARYLQVGAYTDYSLAARHASLLRGLSYPVSERQEGIWLKLLIGPLPIEQINAIKARLDAQGINSFVTQ